MIHLTHSCLRRIAVVLLLVAGGPATGIGAGSLSLAGKMPEDSIPVLKMILETAAKQSPTMITRAIQVEQAEISVDFSRSAMLPGVSGSFSFASSTVYPEIGDANRNSGPYYNFGVSQPIYQWNALKNQTEISKIGVKISQKNYVEGYKGLLGSLRSQFLGLIYRKLALRTQRFNLELTKKYLALDEVRLKAGELSPAQMIVPRMNALDGEIALTRAEEDYEHLKRTIVRLSGIESLPEDSIPLEIPEWSGSKDLVAQLAALLQRDGVDLTSQGQMNSLILKQDALSYKIARVRLLPKFSASVGISQSNNQVVTPTYVSQSSSRSWNYYVVANWSIFDGYATRAAKLAALTAKRSHEHDRAQLLQSMTEDVRNLARVIDLTAQSLAIAEQRRIGDADALKLVQIELSRGQVSENAVDTATARLYGQDAAVAAVRLELQSRWTDLVSTLNADPMLEKLPPAYVH